MFEKIAIETLQFVHEFMVDTKAEVRILFLCYFKVRKNEKESENREE